MKTIIIDGSSWHKKSDVYNNYLNELGAPSWHGQNLDAFWDSLNSDDILSVRQPYQVVILGYSKMGHEAQSLVLRIVNLVHDAQAAGRNVQIEVKA